VFICLLCFLGGRKTGFLFVRHWRIWQFYRDFFPIELVKTCDLDPNKTYMFCSHPHGILCSGAFCAFNTEGVGFSKLFPGLTARLLVLSGQFNFPNLVYREAVLATGSCAATKQGMEALLRQEKGVAAVLVPGGALEALNSDKDKIRLVLNRRKGFIKLALRFGVNLVPTFSFGENFIYDQVKSENGTLLRWFQELAEKWIGFTPVMFFGRGIFQYNYGLIPHRKKISIVVGKPMPVEKVEEPSSEQIENLHAKYVEELQKLYNEYNPVYGDPNVILKIE